MQAFDRIIGYAAIKNELRQISDTLKNRDVYEKLGVTAPRGLLLYGEPGVGKSLMANAVIEASGRKAFTCRKNQPNGDFVKVIKATFDEAAKQTPSIVYLDDLDKFANNDAQHEDAEEYVTVQSCIDEAKDKQVFVLATANRLFRLPYSLYRVGRFDRQIKVNAPSGADAEQIIAHYLESKKFADDADYRTIARIMDGRSCAELETVINQAGLYAGYERASAITMKHFMKACMKTVFHVSDASGDADDDCDGAYDGDDASSALSDSGDDLSQTACHEAGHAVVSEVLHPESITLVSVYNAGHCFEGFAQVYNDDKRPVMQLLEHDIIVTLAGRAAVEQTFGSAGVGCSKDLNHAFRLVDRLVTRECVKGLALRESQRNDSPSLLSVQETVVSSEVERYYRIARRILAQNREFLEKTVTALQEKRLLTTADMQSIKSECRIIPLAM